MLSGKKIILGITGSIAAYKSAYLVRLLVKEGAEVKVIMTGSATEFVTPLTFSVLSGNPVSTTFADRETGEWTNHVELGLWADAMVIAPASANTIAHMAGGICDNLLLAVYLSARCPVIVAPAMDLDMWKHAATQDNLKRLRSFGNKIILPAFGELASGLTGTGRMEEPEIIVKYLNDFFSTSLPLSGKKALVTAGPTYEVIDPVRFIGNRSSGKMGFAIAEELARNGASVTLITGPAVLETPKGVQRVDVESAQQMYNACLSVSAAMDILIMSAAVADYKPENTTDKKIKKQNNSLQISLTPTADILAELGKRKKKKQLLVGFALETDNELKNARAKLVKKNLDLIVLNSLRDPGAGFHVDTNKVTVIDKKKRTIKIPLKSKNEVAADLVKIIVEHSNATR